MCFLGMEMFVVWILVNHSNRWMHRRSSMVSLLSSCFRPYDQHLRNLHLFLSSPLGRATFVRLCEKEGGVDCEVANLQLPPVGHAICRCLPRQVLDDPLCFLDPSAGTR